jgi:hypothetical protein
MITNKVTFSLIGGNVFNDPLVYEDNIYMGSDDMHIYAIDLPGFSWMVS